MKPPTKAEKHYMEAVRELGCLICGRIPEIHHITKCGRRLGHFFTLPLCFGHHQAQSPFPYGYAVHKGTKLFEAKYGTQIELHTRVRIELSERGYQPLTALPNIDEVL